MSGQDHDHAHAHDFKPPGGLLHLQATIFWTVLPEICIFVAWAFLIASLSETVHQCVDVASDDAWRPSRQLTSRFHNRRLEIAPTLLTVFGTVRRREPVGRDSY